MPKVAKHTERIAPEYSEFLRNHGGREQITYAEAGELLSVHPKTIGRWKREGMFTGVGRGRVSLSSIYTHLWPPK
ncbi:hypothetical protein LJC07_04580 [Christensenellaceae bacterium OttesenSCG-928-L17]|nr:hypothetical protein [Christensenellaceae bacterium OttesenSCG-928-L17]